MQEKKELLPVAQMAEAMAARPNKRVNNYKSQSDQHKAEELSRNLANAIDGLKRTQERGSVDLYDFPEVQRRTVEYVEACQKAAVYPSVMGLAVYGFGCSVRWLNKFCAAHPDEPSAKFIEMAKCVFADTLVNASLYGNASDVQTIFQLKNWFDHVDRVELQPVQTKPLEPSKTVEEIAAEYDALPDDP